MQKPWLMLPLCVAAAIPARLFSEARPGRTSAAAEPQSLQATLEQRRAALSALGSRQGDLEMRIVRFQSAPGPALEAELSSEQISQAVQAWLAAQSLTPEVLSKSPAREQAPRSVIAQLPLEELIDQTILLPAFEPDSELIYQELRDSGRMQAVLEGLEARVLADPNNPALRVSLGIAYLEKLFGLEGASLQAGRLAMAADQAFDRALELDPGNVKGRFSKAVALSNWPQFMGKTDAAIEQFKLLVAQTEGNQIREPFSSPYLFLGNMYLRTGEREKAAQTWMRGLERFPGDAALMAQLAAEREAEK